jgi:hypothetical protein
VGIVTKRRLFLEVEIDDEFAPVRMHPIAPDVLHDLFVALVRDLQSVAADPDKAEGEKGALGCTLVFLQRAGVALEWQEPLVRVFDRLEGGTGNTRDVNEDNRLGQCLAAVELLYRAQLEAGRSKRGAVKEACIKVADLTGRDWLTLQQTRERFSQVSPRLREYYKFWTAYAERSVKHLDPGATSTDAAMFLLMAYLRTHKPTVYEALAERAAQAED